MSEEQKPKSKKQIFIEYAILWGPIILGAMIIAIEMNVFR